MIREAVPHPVVDDVSVHFVKYGISHVGGEDLESARYDIVCGHRFGAHAEDFSVQQVYVSVVLRIDGISVALDHVAEMVETIIGGVNVDVLAFRIDDVAAVDGVSDTIVPVVQSLF